MDVEERTHAENLARIHRARLHDLEIKAAMYGKLELPTHIALEINELREKLDVLQQALSKSLPRHNLPQRDYDQFIGRHQELNDVRSLLHPRRRVVVITIDGIGGIGKTTLALETAHYYRENYVNLPEAERFEAVVWVSAKRTYLSATGILERRKAFRTLEDLFAAIAQVLDYPAITRGRVEEQNATIERVLSEHRTLIIVDNLETIDDDELLWFLRDVPDPTKVIVTTRHRIDAAYPIRLTGMPESEALTLISQEATRKGIEIPRKQQQALWRRTGGVPLAIVWSIGLIDMGGDISSVLRRLNNGKSDIARFCFEESVAQIRGQTAYFLLMALSLFSVDASREALGVVAGLSSDPQARDDGISDLVRLSLVNADRDSLSQELPLLEQLVEREVRFRLLPLTKSYLEQEPVAESWVAQAKQRWQDYYLKVVEQNTVWSQDWRLQDIIERELPNILALIDTLESELHYSEGESGLHTIDDASRPIAKQIVRLIRLLDRICRIRGYWIECERLCSLAIEISRAIDETGDIGWRCYTLSRLSYYRGDLVTARRWAAEALHSWQEGNHQAMACLGRRLFGQFALDEGLIDEAEKILIGALNDYLQCGQTSHLPHFISSLGDLCEKKGDYAQAIAYYQEAISGWRKKSDLPYVAYGLINIGKLYQVEGDLSEAEKNFTEGLEVAGECVRRDMIAKAIFQLALVKHAQQQPGAEAGAREALKEFVRLGMAKEQHKAEQFLAQLSVGL